jgi:hypothetical protein
MIDDKSAADVLVELHSLVRSQALLIGLVEKEPRPESEKGTAVAKLWARHRCTQCGDRSVGRPSQWSSGSNEKLSSTEGYRGVTEVKKLLIILLLTTSVGASSSELPQWEVNGLPIIPHQLSVLQPKNVREVIPRLHLQDTEQLSSYRAMDVFTPSSSMSLRRKNNEL